MKGRFAQNLTKIGFKIIQDGDVFSGERKEIGRN